MLEHAYGRIPNAVLGKYSVLPYPQSPWHIPLDDVDTAIQQWLDA
jgi:hypothetical protein